MKQKNYLDDSTYAQTRLPTEKSRSIDPSVYYSSEFFQLEQRQVFGRHWVSAGPADQVANSGDILVTEVAGQSILITRDETGELHAFYNVCRHRGTRLCDRSNHVNKHIVCPYHGWGYNLRGECVGTPLFDKGANRRVIKMHDMSHLEAFDKKDFSLLPVRVAQWGFLIFVCLDDDAPPLQAMLGDLPTRLANYHFEEWVALEERTYDIQCNWKLLFENAIEYYHLPWIHPRLAKTSRIADHHRWQGTGMYCGICTSPITATDTAGWLTMRNLSNLTETENISGYFFGLFPNLIIFVMPSHAFVIKAQPVSPTRTIETAWLMSHPQCFDDMSKDNIREVMDFWNDVNMEDVSICQKVQQGVMTESYTGGRLCYQFEEPVHRFQNMIADAMIGRRHIPVGDDAVQ